ncbi:MAG TPA: CPBP family intramembrane glutamic endopeptidase [Caulobacteraceae bacterium]|nr:CPBP family intramembrane glutamic endopeptidase [Caulobacteraceae bacterium]
MTEQARERGRPLTGPGQRLADSAFLANVGAPEHSLWRFVVTVMAGSAVFLIATVVVLAAVVAAFVVWAGWPVPSGMVGLGALQQRLVALAASNGRRFGDAMQILALAIPTNVAPMFAFVGVAMLVHRQPLRRFLTAAPRFRWSVVVIGAVLSFVLIGPFLIVPALFGPKAPTPPILAVSSNDGLRAVYGLVCVVGFLAAALGEETLFRGWLLRETSGVTRNVAVLMVVNGAVFAAAHMQFEPDAFLARWVMGAGLTYMTLKLGGVELSTGAHLANNLMVVLLQEPLTLKPPPNAGLSPMALAPYLGLFIAYVAIAEVTARWPPLRRWSGARLAAEPLVQQGAGPWDS